MLMYEFRPLPGTFRLRNLADISSRGFGPAKFNPHGKEIRETMREWFMSFKGYNNTPKALAYISQFTNVALVCFPDVDVDRLEACVGSLYWGFVADDNSDEGELQLKPDSIRDSRNGYLEALTCQDFSSPDPHAMMLHDIFKRFQLTASPGACMRFVRAVEEFCNSEINQSLRRSQDRIPAVSEFILGRRGTVGGSVGWAIVEYSLNLNLPDFVFSDPIVLGMSNAITDIMGWQNDLYSFNKEQAKGDFQNLVCCILVERMVELQEAIDILINMLDSRVSEYIDLKSQLPSFGPEIDHELSKYFTGVEHMVQGGIS